jgi:hypothetical protein
MTCLVRTGLLKGMGIMSPNLWAATQHSLPGGCYALPEPDLHRLEHASLLGALTAYPLHQIKLLAHRDRHSLSPWSPASNRSVKLSSELRVNRYAVTGLLLLLSEGAIAQIV